MEIWDKYQGRSRECIDELIAKLDDLGYEKIRIDDSWIEETPILPIVLDFTNNIYEYVQLASPTSSSPSPSSPPSPTPINNIFTLTITRSKTKDNSKKIT